MEQRAKERFDYKSLIIKALDIYFQYCADINNSSARNCILTNIWYSMKPYWSGESDGLKWDMAPTMDKLMKQRNEEKTDKNVKMTIDAERIGVIMETLEKKKLLIESHPILEAGAAVGEDGELIIDE